MQTYNIGNHVPTPFKNNITFGRHVLIQIYLIALTSRHNNGQLDHVPLNEASQLRVQVLWFGTKLSWLRGLNKGKVKAQKGLTRDWYKKLGIQRQRENKGWTNNAFHRFSISIWPGVVFEMHFKTNSSRVLPWMINTHIKK